MTGIVPGRPVGHDGGRRGPPDARLAAAQRLFSPERAYLNTATYGLPPRTAFDALAAATDEWRHGRTGFDGWDRSVGAARAAFARLAGVGRPTWRSAPRVSAFAGLVAASLPAGARVLCAEGDFTSLLFPFLAQERARRDGRAGRRSTGSPRRSTGARPGRGQRGAER